MIIALLSAGHGLSYHDALKKRPWLRSLALDDPGIAVHVLAAALAGALVLWLTLPAEELSMLVEEGGPIERPTVWLYLLAALAAWYLRSPTDDPRTTLAVSGLLLAFGARELDLHKAWDGASMLRVSFFSGDAPLDVKLVMLLVVLLLARWAGHLLLRHAPRVLRGAAQRDPAATSVVVFLAALVLVSVLDRSASVLAQRFDVHVGASVGTLLRALEEVAELVLPLIALLAMCQRKYLRPLDVPSTALTPTVIAATQRKRPR